MMIVINIIFLCSVSFIMYINHFNVPGCGDQCTHSHSHYGDISFQVAAAKLWNAAPFQLKSIQNIDSFKSKLKTYLFMLNV